MGRCVGWISPPYVRAHQLALLFLVLFATAVHAGEPLSRDAQRRASERQARMKFFASLPEAEKKVQTAYLGSLAATGKWLIEQNAINEAAELVTVISLVDDKAPALEEMKKLCEGRVPKALDDAGKKELESRRKKARQQRAVGLIELAKSCNSAGLLKPAYNYVLAAVDADPENPTGRQALGHVKVGDKWMDGWSASQAQKGLAYAPGMGWVPAAGLERALKGEWMEGGRWMPSEDADKLHATSATGWNIETAHFTIKSAAPRKRLMQFAERLDAFRDTCYPDMLPFFIRPEKRSQLVFNHPHKPKLNVAWYADRGEYESLIRKDFKEPFRTLLLIVPGFYYTQKHMTISDAGEVDNLLRQLFLQHEIARHILWETGGGGTVGPKPWITNASAGVLMFARPDPQGKWVLGSRFGHPAVEGASAKAEQGFLPSIAKMMQMDEADFNKYGGNDEDRRQICAAFGRFLLDYQDGAYANDFWDIVYDSLRSPNGVKAQDYFGDLNELEGHFFGYLRR